MYRVIVLDGNENLGPHYCFTRKAAKHLAKLFAEMKYDVCVHRFIRIKTHFFFWQDNFCWSDAYEEVGFDVDEFYEEEE